MFDYQIIKEKFYRLAQDAENNVRKDKLKAPKAPIVYEGLHDTSLARRDIYMFLAMSHYENKQEFIAALKNMLENPAKNSGAFDEQKYAQSYANYLTKLITEYQ